MTLPTARKPNTVPITTTSITTTTPSTLLTKASNPSQSIESKTTLHHPDRHSNLQTNLDYARQNSLSISSDSESGTSDSDTEEANPNSTMNTTNQPLEEEGITCLSSSSTNATTKSTEDQLEALENAGQDNITSSLFLSCRGDTNTVTSSLKRVGIVEQNFSMHSFVSCHSEESLEGEEVCNPVPRLSCSKSDRFLSCMNLDDTGIRSRSSDEDGDGEEEDDGGEWQTARLKSTEERVRNANGVSFESTSMNEDEDETDEHPPSSVNAIVNQESGGESTSVANADIPIDLAAPDQLDNNSKKSNNNNKNDTTNTNTNDNSSSSNNNDNSSNDDGNIEINPPVQEATLPTDDLRNRLSSVLYPSKKDLRQFHQLRRSNYFATLDHDPQPPTNSTKPPPRSNGHSPLRYINRMISRKGKTPVTASTEHAMISSSLEYKSDESDAISAIYEPNETPAGSVSGYGSVTSMEDVSISSGIQTANASLPFGGNGETDVGIDRNKHKRHTLPPSLNVYEAKERRRRRRKRANVPCNAVPVKCVGKPKKTSDLAPLLLISTLTKVHAGAVWCTAFSNDGTYFATGGMDGVLQIWDVAPDQRLNGVEEEGSRHVWLGREHISRTTVTSTTNHTSNGDSDDTVGTDNSSCAPPPTTANGRVPARGTEVRILSSTPRQRFDEHKKDVVDVSWSSTDFLLSASLDKTVGLWHHSQPKCLKFFKHADLVTSVSFHPKDDRYFLSGGFDRKLRVWSIPDTRVKHYEQTSQYVTAAKFQPDGEVVVVGLFDGKVMFYNVDGRTTLKYHTQISCKNRRAASVGEKVTGLEFLKDLSHDKLDGHLELKQKQDGMHDKQLHRNLGVGTLLKKIQKGGGKGGKKKKKKWQVLVTTNDSRVRLVCLHDFRIVRKYKGVFNSSLQIEAHISESGEFIACGSDARTCTVWNTATKRNPLNINVTDFSRYDKVGVYESFEATKADPCVVTDAVFVPRKGMERAIDASGLGRGESVKDLSSAAIVTSDYEGTVRVFLRSGCIGQGKGELAILPKEVT